MAVVVSGVDSMAVSILGASSETLVAFPLSGDFERPNDLNCDVNRRPRPSFLGVSGLVSVVAAGVSSVVTTASDVVGSEVSVCSPFVAGAGVALSLVSFFGIRPENRLPRFFSFSGLGSDETAGVSSVGSTTAGVVSSTADSVTGAGSVDFASAIGSGVGSLAAALLLPKSPVKPERDLRLSFFDGSAVDSRNQPDKKERNTSSGFNRSINNRGFSSNGCDFLNSWSFGHGSFCNRGWGHVFLGNLWGNFLVLAWACQSLETTRDTTCPFAGSLSFFAGKSSLFVGCDGLRRFCVMCR